VSKNEKKNFFNFLRFFVRIFVRHALTTLNRMLESSYGLWNYLQTFKIVLVKNKIFYILFDFLFVLLLDML
jgi:hypothetical protein